MGAPGQYPYPRPYHSQNASPSAQKGSGRAWRWGIGGFILGLLVMPMLLFFLSPHATPIAAPTGKGNVTITVDDTFITRQAARGISQAQINFAISNVRAHIAPGNLLNLQGNTSGLLGSQQFAATTQLSVANGHLVSHITSAQVGADSLPFPITAALDDAINAQLAKAGDTLLPGSTGLTLSGVTTTSGQLTLQVTQH